MNISEKVYEIAGKIRLAGGRAMLVGGCVRDRLLNIPCKDYDLEVYNLSPDELLRAITPVCEIDAVGMSFGVFKVKHFDIDISLPRKDSKTGRGHRGFIVETDKELDFASACARRDFTVNAILQDALTGEIIDPFNGMEDLKNKILRHVSPAFTEDPLRVLRGMQFIARFDLTPDAETIRLCSTVSQTELSIERLSSEWEKLLLKGKHICRALNFLRDCSWVRFYPELSALIGCPQYPLWHPEGDVWNHTLLVTEAAANLRKNSPDDLILMTAALCHDFGKPACTIREADGKITSCGHDSLTLPAEKFIRSIWLRQDLPQMVIPLIARHMHPWQLASDDASDKAFRHLALHVKRMDLLADLAEADLRGCTVSPDILSEKLALIGKFRQRCEALAIADKIPAPLILGRHLIARNMVPGREFKPLLDQCFEAQLAGEFSTLDDALKYLDKLLCGK